MVKFKMKDEEMENRLREAIRDYQGCCISRCAESQDARKALSDMRRFLLEMGLEFCAHNAAFFGFKRYEKYANKSLNRPVTIKEYPELVKRGEL